MQPVPASDRAIPSDALRAIARTVMADFYPVSAALETDACRPPLVCGPGPVLSVGPSLAPKPTHRDPWTNVPWGGEPGFGSVPVDVIVRPIDGQITHGQ